ncbi:MAG: hypothetical protein CM1200mP39_02300 [Dehalococcoidia bacterium]|nr:MAG: hypothetical protein CM1200mP39_02300 [Dehalococcoidia bacterium]
MEQRLSPLSGWIRKGEHFGVSKKVVLTNSSQLNFEAKRFSNRCKENGAFSLDVAADDWGEGIYTILATGDQGNRGATAVLLVDKVDG